MSSFDVVLDGKNRDDHPDENRADKSGNAKKHERLGEGDGRLELAVERHFGHARKPHQLLIQASAFLREEGRLEESTALAIKRVLAWEFQRAMIKADVSQAEMARRMHTSRAVIRRLLDANDSSITLSTISKAATALGKNLRLKLAA